MSMDAAFVHWAPLTLTLSPGGRASDVAGAVPESKPSPPWGEGGRQAGEGAPRSNRPGVRPC